MKTVKTAMGFKKIGDSDRRNDLITIAKHSSAASLVSNR
jgi:hypothetical protein